jgi:hypothetical protein
MKIKKTDMNIIRKYNYKLKSNTCDLIINQIKDCIKKDTNVQNLRKGTEMRIFNFEKISPEAKLLCENLMRDIPLKKNKFKLDTCLAIKNKPIKDHEDKLFGWHLDQVRDQFKIFVYLNDVDILTGPTEFISGTNSFYEKISGIFNYKYIRISDFFKKEKYRSYMNIDRDYVKKKLRKYNLISLLASKGEVFFANTSSIHRARPCEQKVRYALTLYLNS